MAYMWEEIFWKKRIWANGYKGWFVHTHGGFFRVTGNELGYRCLILNERENLILWISSKAN